MTVKIVKLLVFILLTTAFVSVCNAQLERQDYTAVFQPKKDKDGNITPAKRPVNNYIVNFENQFDKNVYPIHPQKPCSDCVRPERTRPKTRFNLTGIKGRPHMDRPGPGGSTCGKKNCNCKRPMFSVYWPRPFSARMDERHPERAHNRYTQCQPKKVVDVFNNLQNFRLIDYTRTDNGYCGSNRRGAGADPYGCLGESKQFSRVSGLQFRPPGEPVNFPFPQYNTIRIHNESAQLNVPTLATQPSVERYNLGDDSVFETQPR